MFDKKLLLYTALAFVVFALWSAWQKDYIHEPVAATTTAATVSSVTSASVAASVPTSSTQSDFTVAPSDSTAETVGIKKSKLITVQTDVLKITIDTKGGNIVKAELLKYPQELHGTKPVVLFDYEDNNFYVAKSGIAGEKVSDENILYQATQQKFVLAPNENTLKVALIWHSPKGYSVTKTYTFEKQKYQIGLNYEVDNKSSQTWTGQFFALLQKKHLPEKKSFFQFSTYTGAAISSSETPYEKIDFTKLEKENIDRNILGGWVTFQQRYFLSVWIPDQSKIHHYFSTTAKQLYSLGFSDASLVAKPQEKISFGATLYVGPEDADFLKPLATGLDRTVDYGWLWIISVALFWLLKNINVAIGNWGWSIVIVTILIKLAFYKPSEKSFRSMAKMKELSPKIQALKERYGSDKQKLNQSIMELYRKEQVSPLSGCLPMLIQIPFFIALYYVLMGAVELRQAHFMFWIHDLSIKDPYYILPILMGLSMFFQQRLSPPASADPAQAKVMMLMPVIFTVFFLSFPAGLVLYWLVNNLLTIAQQLIINKQMQQKVGKS